MKLNVFPTATDAARSMVRSLIQKTNDDPERLFHIAFSGGETPLLMFKIWAEEFSGATPWSRICFWWVDERCVKPTHSQSNYGQMKKTLLDKVPVPKEHIFRIHGERDPEKEAFRYSKEVQKYLPQKNGLPVFDLVLLGVGEDGHTSSIFPGQEELLIASTLYAPSVHPATGQRRIAMTGAPILNAAQVLFLVTGAAKEKVAHQLYTSGDLTPSAYIARRSNRVELFLDSAAAGKLVY